MNIFAVKYIFHTKEESNKVPMTESKFQSTFHISLIVFTIYDLFPVRFKNQIKHKITDTLPPGAKKGLWKNKNSNHIIRKMVSFKIQENLFMNL